MKTLVLEESVKVENGELFLFYEGYKFFLKTVYSYGEDKWECVSKNCRAALYLLENKENVERKSHVILTYKSTLSHNHTVGGKRHETVIQKKRRIQKEEENKEVKIMKVDFSYLYPWLVTTNRTLPVQEQNDNTTEVSYNQNIINVPPRPISRPSTILEPTKGSTDFSIDKIIGRKSNNHGISKHPDTNGDNTRRKTVTTPESSFVLNDSNPMDLIGLNDRVGLNEDVTYSSLLNEVQSNDYVVFCSNSMNNPHVNYDLPPRLPMKDLYYYINPITYNLPLPIELISQRTVCNEPMDLPLPIELINQRTVCNEPIDLSVIKID